MKQTAVELILALDEHGVYADRYHAGVEASGVFGVNVWPSEGRYPIASVTVDDKGYIWGLQHEHEMPLEASAEDVAVAVIATLHMPEFYDTLQWATFDPCDVEWASNEWVRANRS